MSDVFKEVDEDLRREQLKTIWDRFGAYIIAVAVLIVVGTAGYRLWEYWQDRKAEQQGDLFVTAMTAATEGRLAEAISGFEAIGAEGGAYGILARMQAAIAKSQSGLPGAAAAELDAIAADNSAPQILRDIARLRASLLVLDVADLASMRARLDPLAGVGGPFRHSAREILGLSAWRNGDVEAAGTYFEQILADTGVPAGISDRADMMLSLIRARTDLATIAEPTPPPITLPNDLPAFALPGGQAIGPLDPLSPATPAPGAPFAPTPAPSPFAPGPSPFALPGPAPFAPAPAAAPEPAPAITPEPAPAATPAPAGEAPAPAATPAPAAEPAPPAAAPAAPP